MARLSNKVKNWRPSKGKCTTTMSIYEACCGNRDTLFDIHIQNKSWGNEWYECVRQKSYDNAKMILCNRGKGTSLAIALVCIKDLEALEKQLKEVE